MKKSYINPSMEIVKIQTQQMLAVSTQNVEFGEGTMSGGNACSRDFDFDDEEEW